MRPRTAWPCTPPLPQFDGHLNISIARAAPARKHRAKKCTKNTKKQPAKSSKQALDSQNSTRSFVERFSTPCGKPCVKPAPMGPKSGFSGGFSTLSTGFSTLKWNKMASTRRITRRWPLCGNGGACLVLTRERRARGAQGGRGPLREAFASAQSEKTGEKDRNRTQDVI